MIITVCDQQGARAGTDDRIVPWWSFTKTVLALAALKLAENGKLDLDACMPGKLYSYRQVLQHTSGLTDYGMLRDYHLAVRHHDEPWSADEMLERANIEQLRFQPGTGWSYSNVGYLLLSQELERLCDQSIDSVLNDLFLTALELDDVHFIRSAQAFKALQLKNQTYHPGWCYHGLLAGKTESAVRFLSALAQGELIADSLLQQMLQPYRLNVDIGNRPWKSPAVGLGVMMDCGDHLFSFGHTGQGPGSTIAVSHFVGDTPVTVAVFAEVDDQAIVENKAVEVSRS